MNLPKSINQLVKYLIYSILIVIVAIVIIGFVDPLILPLIGLNYLMIGWLVLMVFWGANNPQNKKITDNRKKTKLVIDYLLIITYTEAMIYIGFLYRYPVSSFEYGIDSYMKANNLWLLMTIVFMIALYVNSVRMGDPIKVRDTLNIPKSIEETKNYDEDGKYIGSSCTYKYGDDK
jgi:hypothetical protein